MSIQRQKNPPFVSALISQLSIIEWMLVEVGLVLFGIMVVAWQPQIISWLAWYWWIGAAFVITGYIALITDRKRLLQKNKTVKSRNPLIYMFQQAKQNMSIIDWALAKGAIVFFGVGLAVSFPIIPLSLPVSYWFILCIAITAIPAYLLYIYQPKTETTFSKMRTQYARSDRFFSKTTRATEKLVGDGGKHPGAIMFRSRRGKKQHAINILPRKKKGK